MLRQPLLLRTDATMPDCMLWNPGRVPVAAMLLGLIRIGDEGSRVGR